MAGSLCNCILPEALKISAVQHDPNCQPYDSEKRSLRSTFSCLSSISMRQKQLSTSSLFLQSPLRGCLPPWELKRSSNGSLKERWKTSLVDVDSRRFLWLLYAGTFMVTRIHRYKREKIVEYFDWVRADSNLSLQASPLLLLADFLGVRTEVCCLFSSKAIVKAVRRFFKIFHRLFLFLFCTSYFSSRAG